MPTVEITLTHSMEDIGPAQSAPTADQKEHADEFTAGEFDGNDLTVGNLKLLTRSLKALANGGDKPEDLDVALDVRPTLVQASNLLVSEKQCLYFRPKWCALLEHIHISIAPCNQPLINRFSQA